MLGEKLEKGLERGYRDLACLEICVTSFKSMFTVLGRLCVCTSPLVVVLHMFLKRLILPSLWCTILLVLGGMAKSFRKSHSYLNNSSRSLLVLASYQYSKSISNIQLSTISEMITSNFNHNPTPSS